MSTEEQIIEALADVCKKFSQDDYDEWAILAIPVYQRILNATGLGVFSVMGGHPNDENLDDIVLRTPWGEEKTFPDPKWIDEPSTVAAQETKYTITVDKEEAVYCDIRELVLFFMELDEKVWSRNRAENIELARTALDKAKTLVGAGHAAGEESTQSALRDAMVHVSVAMWSKPKS